MTNSGIKRAISLFLVLALMLSVFPMTAAADTAALSVKQGGKISLGTVDWKALFDDKLEAVIIPDLGITGVSFVDASGSTVAAGTEVPLLGISSYYITATTDAEVKTYETKQVQGKSSVYEYQAPRYLHITVEKIEPVTASLTVKTLGSVSLSSVNWTGLFGSNLAYISFTLDKAFSVTRLGYPVSGSAHQISVGQISLYELSASASASTSEIVVTGYTAEDKKINECKLKMTVEMPIVAAIEVSYYSTTPVLVSVDALNKAIADAFGSEWSIDSVDGITYSGNGVFLSGGNAITSNSPGTDPNSIYFQAGTGSLGSATATYTATATDGDMNSFQYTGTIRLTSSVNTASDIEVNLVETDTLVQIPVVNFLSACGLVTANKMSLALSTTNTQIAVVYIVKTAANGAITKTPVGTTALTLGITDYVEITFVDNQLTKDASLAFTLTVDGKYYQGGIYLTAYKAPTKPTDVNVDEFNISLSGATQSANFSISDISERCGKDVKLTGITFTFADSDLSMKLGNESVVSNKAYEVINSSSVSVTSKNYTSDVRVYYIATADNGTRYLGSIVFKKLKTGTVTDISAYSIYVPGGSYYGQIDAAEISAKIKNDYITTFKIVNAQITYVTGQDSKGQNITDTKTVFDGTKWTNNNTYGYLSASNTKPSAIKEFTLSDSLFYVPGTTSGTVTITYYAYGRETIYTGTLTYTVYNGSGLDVELNLKSRDPFTLTSADTEKVIFADQIKSVVELAFGKAATADYIVFAKPATTMASYGTLYSNSSLSALSTVNGYYFTAPVADKATNPISGLYYVPTMTAGTYKIDYTLFVTFNKTTYEFNGSLTIKTPSDTKVDADVLYQTTTNNRVNFAVSDFSDYLKAIRSSYAFESVKFGAVPDVGTLYYSSTALTKDTIGNYNFYSTTANSHASLANVSYLPTGTNYYVTIPFTVYYKQSSTSTVTSSREGTLVITVTSGVVQDIKYSIKSSDLLTLDVTDFRDVCEAATGMDLSHVYFNVASVSGGKLYHKTTSSSVGSSTPFYVATNKTTTISNVKFKPSVTSGQASFTYTAYSSGGTYLYTGKVIITFYTETKTPTHKSCVLSAQKMVCNGESVSLQAYNIDGYNYLKLRDIAALMASTGSRFSIQVVDTATKKEVYCTLGGSYTKVSDDLKTGTDQSKTCVASSWAFYVDGAYKSVYVYNIGGYNYFKLRDLGDALAFNVDYNETTNTAIISSSDYRG